MKILDCTFRDGGYYTQWDFDAEMLTQYCQYINALPIDYIEIGYRNPPVEGNYFGAFYFLDAETIASVKKACPKKQIAVMLDVKYIADTSILQTLLSPVKDNIDLIRLTVNVQQFGNLEAIVQSIIQHDIKIALNVMYISKVEIPTSFYELLNKYADHVKYFYLVDSYGNITPSELKNLIQSAKSQTEVPLGFHGHNNMELALANSIVAMENGVSVIDTTVLGMGRGAGNLKLELLLAYLMSKKQWEVDVYALNNLVDLYKKLHEQYNWGSNLAYIVSGAVNAPQKTVMEYLSTNRYSIQEIIRGLLTQASPSTLNTVEISNTSNYQEALIIGGGKTIQSSLQQIKKYVHQQNPLLVICSIKYLDELKDILHKAVLCISGSQLDLLAKQHPDKIDLFQKILVPSNNSKIPVMIPKSLEQKLSTFDTYNYTDADEDSPFLLSMSFAAKFVSSKTIKLIGFDGYTSANKRMLNKVNQKIINFFHEKDFEIHSLTRTSYYNIVPQSIYAKTLHL